MNLAIAFACYFLFLYPIMAIAEYIAHRWFMHKSTPINRFGYRTHLLEHHRLGANDDWPHIRLRIRDHLLFGSPVIVGLLIRGCFGYPNAFVCLAALLTWFVIHCRLYSAMHRSHHDLERNWTDWLPGSSRMREHHELHHRFPRTNYAVVLGVPFGIAWVDWMFGTRRV